MRTFPVADPGEPDIRSATHYLVWVVRQQLSIVLGLVCFGILWMAAQAVLPYAVGKVIDDGMAARNVRELLLWTGVLLGLGVTIAATGLVRHRFAVVNWLSAAYRTIQLTGCQAVNLGAALPKLVAIGEVVSIGNSDVARIGGAIDVLGRATGSVVAIVLMSVIMLASSVPLGLLVMIGVPLLMVAIAPLFKPLHRRQSERRELYGALTGRANDIVAGLRVLRGVGGEQSFVDTYRAESQRVRAAGVRVGQVQSVLEALQYLIPGVFLVLVTWVGARLALAGELTAGELVAFYGYAAFLVAPMRTLTEAADKIIKANVAAKRVVRVLALRQEISTTGDVHPPIGEVLHDPASGCSIVPGRLTAIAAGIPEEAAAVVDRLGRYADSGATWGEIPLSNVSLAAVRERILVADNDARIFAGRLRTELAPGDATDSDIHRALHAAGATDIVEALPGGLDEAVTERGRSFSGGQLQRLRLARALVLDPEILLLVEPTSAVDVHTEARIAQRLRDARAGRTTVVCTSSPLLLDRADRVLYVHAGVAVAEGTHRELLAAHAGYRSTVTRGET